MGLKICYTRKSWAQQKHVIFLHNFTCSVLCGTLSTIKGRLSKDDTNIFLFSILVMSENFALNMFLAAVESEAVCIFRWTFYFLYTMLVVQQHVHCVAL